MHRDSSWVAEIEPMVRRLARRMLGVDAEDGVQEVLLAIQAGLVTFRGDSALSTWGYRIALRTLGRLVENRRARRDRERSEGDPMVALTASEVDRLNDGGLVDMEGAERRALVRDGIALLPEHLRAVLALRSGEGLAYAEIADALGIPLGTVKSRIASATTLLGQRLARYRDSGAGVDGRDLENS